MKYFNSVQEVVEYLLVVLEQNSMLPGESCSTMKDRHDETVDLPEDLFDLMPEGFREAAGRHDDGSPFMTAHQLYEANMEMQNTLFKLAGRQQP